MRFWLRSERLRMKICFVVLDPQATEDRARSSTGSKKWLPGNTCRTPESDVHNSCHVDPVVDKATMARIQHSWACFNKQTAVPYPSKRFRPSLPSVARGMRANFRLRGINDTSVGADTAHAAIYIRLPKAERAYDLD